MRMQIFALLFFAPLLVNSQSVSPSVIASAGGSSTLSNGISIDWTLGEFAVTTLTNGSITLTQGFHQPNLEASVSYEDPTFGYAIRAFPNPTASIFSMETLFPDELRWQLSDLSGRILLKSEFHHSEELDLTRYPNSVYLLYIFSEEKLVKTVKIHKIR